MAIESFDGKYAFLSNFFAAPTSYDGVVYPTAENAYQAAKTLRPFERALFLNIPPGKAKKLGRRVVLRPDWEDIKLAVMMDCVGSKFLQHGRPTLVDQLLETGHTDLIEGNYWHDNFWGDCTCQRCEDIPGQNVLGMLLMRLRDDIRYDPR